MNEKKTEAVYGKEVELSDTDLQILVYPDFELSYIGNGEQLSFGIRMLGSATWDRVTIDNQENFTFNTKTYKLNLLEQDTEHGYVKFVISK